MSRRGEIAAALAAAFLADGDWTPAALAKRGRGSLATRARWVERVAEDVVAAYHRRPADRPRELADFVEIVLAQRRVRGRRPRHWLAFEQRMAPAPWPVRPFATIADLAAALELDVGQLQWLADPRGLERRVDDERLRNYRYRWIPRRGAPPRLIESPKLRLKEVQRIVLRDVLDRIPPHAAAHGFTPGRSARSNARCHVGQRVVLHLDLEDFFASVEAGRVYGVFRTAGYPESVAYLLTALCTNVVPARVWAALPLPRDGRVLARHHRLGRRLAAPHLPQGAPTSPALANLAAFRLDRRLAGLAASVGATYTRYADDVAFSGDTRFLGRARDVRRLAGQIAREEGFTVNEQKSRLTTRAGRQVVTGVVVNDRPNVARTEFDRLKAIVHNAARDGAPRSERARLVGRIAWVEQLNPTRGAKLRERFAAIEWRDDG